ncbi:MAG: polyhydroxyalkanoic acid system family protein [Thiohalocapsa sp.]|nr:polyhydroxyalkanoic acid system family protein [Thiohalocapsa sp.]
MSIIRVSRDHNLGLDAARTEIERIAKRVEDDFGAQCSWDGDSLHFSRPGVSGHITVTADALDLTIRLGLLMSAMKGQIEQKIVAKIDDALARTAASGET